MIRRWLHLLLVVTLLVTACGSRKMPPAMTPTSSISPGEVRLSEKDNGRQIEINESQILVISLEGNPSTGYTWEVEEVNEKVLRQKGEIEFEPESDLLGASGKQILRFETVGAGQTTLKLIYHRPWEKAIEPAETFFIQVVVH